MNLALKEYSCLEVRFGTKLNTNKEDDKEKSLTSTVIFPYLIKERGDAQIFD